MELPEVPAGAWEAEPLVCLRGAVRIKRELLPEPDTLPYYVACLNTVLYVDLKDAAVRMYPDTKEWFGGGDMEYGYHLKMFPDEPIKVADPAVYQRELDKSKNPFLQWASALTNPLATN